MTIHRILVGLDGSPLAETILGTVRALAGRLGAEVVLLHVTPIPEAMSGAAARAGVNLDEVVAQDRQRAHEYLDGVARRLREAGVGVRIATAAGEAAAEIVGHAEREHLDLIALATHGRSGLQRWIYGSVADAVLHTATTPLLLIRPAGDGVEAALTLQRIIVPLDGSSVAEAALPLAEHLAAALRIPLVLLRVVESTTLAFAADPFGGVYLDYQRLFDVLGEDAERYLTTLATNLRTKGFTVETMVSGGTAADAITEAARAHPGSLLVLSTHGRSGWRAMTLGSVARRVVLLAAGHPVLVVRPAEASSPEK